MTRYLLNSCVIAAGREADGTYTKRTVNETFASAWLQVGPFVSRIGYPSTADYLRSLAPGVEVPLSREMSTLAAGDEALVCRLVYRVEPADKRNYTPQPGDFVLELLRRIDQEAS